MSRRLGGEDIDILIITTPGLRWHKAENGNKLIVLHQYSSWERFACLENQRSKSWILIGFELWPLTPEEIDNYPLKRPHTHTQNYLVPAREFYAKIGECDDNILKLLSLDWF